MVDRIKDTKLFTTVYDVVEMIATGYYDVGKISFGPYLKLVSYNPLEGLRLRVGTRTTASFSRKDRIGGYVAYGFKDSQVKGGVSWEHLFSKDPTRKLTLDAITTCSRWQKAPTASFRTTSSPPSLAAAVPRGFSRCSRAAPCTNTSSADG